MRDTAVAGYPSVSNSYYHPFAQWSLTQVLVLDKLARLSFGFNNVVSLFGKVLNE